MPGRDKDQRRRGGRLEWHSVGQGEQVALWHGGELGKKAVDVLAEDGEVVAHVVEAEAREAVGRVVAAGGVDGHAVTDAEAADRLAHGRDDARAVRAHDVGPL